MRPPIPGRTARGWTESYEWADWMRIAGHLVAEDPAARDEALAQRLLDEAASRGVERKQPIGAAEVAATRAAVESLARSIAAQRGLDPEVLIALAEPTIPDGTPAEMADALWTEQLLRLVSLSTSPDLDPADCLIHHRAMAPSAGMKPEEKIS
jgi:hypothetical protein